MKTLHWTYSYFLPRIIEGCFTIFWLLSVIYIFHSIFFSDYTVGSACGWSDIFWFNTYPAPSEKWSPSFAVYGDMGNKNAVSLPALQRDTQSGMYDMILHVGDFAYDMNNVSMHLIKTLFVMILANVSILGVVTLLGDCMVSQ